MRTLRLNEVRKDPKTMEGKTKDLNLVFLIPKPKAFSLNKLTKFKVFCALRNQFEKLKERDKMGRSFLHCWEAQ